MKNFIFWILMFGAMGSTYPTGLSAQGKRTRALITFADGEEKRGYIEKKRWFMNPSSVKYYRNSKTDRFTILKPQDLLQLKVENQIFRPAIVTVESSPRKKKYLLTDTVSQYRTDTTFLLTIIDGPKSLYEYRDSKSNLHYFIDIDGEIVYLYYRKWADRYGHYFRDHEQKRFIGHIGKYLHIDGWLPDYSRIEYTRKSLKKIFMSYYQKLEISPGYVL